MRAGLFYCSSTRCSNGGGGNHGLARSSVPRLEGAKPPDL